ncbi:hypothetical protein GCM10022280_18940 [Sphingomonas swuensis]|uniref:Uncharacterized protein n=1 Tax=Sphingomonas swuensis TaxID=977800 RepID=A0ABP7T0Y8_9SPHN
MRKLLLAAAMAAFGSSPAAAETVRGTGSAAITKDVESVRNAAERAARRELIIAMLRQSIGNDRLREVPASSVDAVASQIRDDMITNRSSRREGQVFFVDLDADIDGAWFSEQLSNFNIRLPSETGSAGATILVMLDQEEGMASNFSKPAESTVEYDRQTGASYRDHSAEATSQRSASASSSKSAVGYSGSYRSATGVSTGYGSGASVSRGRASGAAVAKSSSAAVNKYDHASKTRIDAEVHDNVRYREHIVWQRPAQNSDAGLIMAALVGELNGFGIATADSARLLTDFFQNKPPRLSALESDARFGRFLDAASRGEAQFFMSGKLEVRYQTDVATQQVACDGALHASAFATSTQRNVGSGVASGSTIGRSETECRGKLAQILAKDAAGKIGPQVQRFWRNQARTAQVMNAAVDTTQAADYSLVLRSSKLDMAMQADLLDALQSTPGVQSQGFISQSGTEMRFAVRYAGSVPLQLALFQKLRSNPQFAKMQSTVQGRSVLLCLSGCAAGQ